MSTAPVTVVDLVAAIRRRQSGVAGGGAALAADGPRIHVHSAYPGCGASTVSIALAEALVAGDPGGATVVDLGDDDALGVGAAMEARADMGLQGWTGGRRGGVRIVRLGEDPDGADRIAGMSVVDAGFHDWLLTVDVLVARATVPGVLRAEKALASGPARVVAVVAATKWPPSVRACLGPRLRMIDTDGRVVFFPSESQLAINGLSAEPLPTSTRRAASRLLDVLEIGGAGSEKDGAGA